MWMKNDWKTLKSPTMSLASSVPSGFWGSNKKKCEQKLISYHMAMGQNPGTLISHQNNWDLWMFIPSNMVFFIGFDLHVIAHFSPKNVPGFPADPASYTHGCA
jgi:hypothetical protein